MILKNQLLIFAYIILVLVFFYIFFTKKKKYTLFFIIYFLVLLSTLYYYRPLHLDDILDKRKYEALFEDSIKIVIEECTNSTLKNSDVINHLKKMKIRNVSNNYEEIYNRYSNNMISYVVQQDDKKIFRIAILGNYEYVEYQGVYYKYIK